LRNETTSNAGPQVQIIENVNWHPHPLAKPSDPIDKVYDLPDETEELPCPDDGATDMLSDDPNQI
jgi:hypothetical protein